MSQTISAAVVRESGGKLQIEPVTLGAPRPHEVVVKLVATGVCHTDMVVRDQLFPAPLPLVLGHEGAGQVVAVGTAVKSIELGDRVVMTFMSCGHCNTCVSGHPAHCENMGPLNFGGAREDGSAAMCDCHGAVVHSHFFRQSSFCSAILDHVTPEMAIYGEEAFGPITTIVRVANADEAVDVANDTAYGLSSAVFGQGMTRAMAV